MADKLVITIECDPKSGGEETADIISKRLRIKIYDKKTLAAESDDDLSDKIIKTALIKVSIECFMSQMLVGDFTAWPYITAMA